MIQGIMTFQFILSQNETTGEINPEFSPIQLVFSNKNFDENNFSNHNLVCPVETRKIVVGIEKAPEDLKNVLNKCFLMYQIGATVGKDSPTIRASYEYGSIDTIVNSNKSEYKSFTDFIAMINYINGTGISQIRTILLECQTKYQNP